MAVVLAAVVTLALLGGTSPIACAQAPKKGDRQTTSAAGSGSTSQTVEAASPHSFIPANNLANDNSTAAGEHTQLPQSPRLAKIGPSPQTENNAATNAQQPDAEQRDAQQDDAQHSDAQQDGAEQPDAQQDDAPQGGAQQAGAQGVAQQKPDEEEPKEQNRGDRAAHDRAKPAKPAARKFQKGVLIRFEGTITPMLEHYVYRKLDTARQQGADLVVLEIDSPGGYVASSLNLAYRLLESDDLYVVAYVPRQALSGAAIVALGANEIVMHPRAVLGDAGPIFMDENFMFRHAPEKIRSDLVRKMRDLAQARNRPPALVEAMANMDVVVYRVQNQRTGEITFLSDEEIEATPDPRQWQKLNPVFESRAGHFLEVNGRRAVELGLAEATVDSLDQLLERYGLEGPLPVLRPTAVDTAVYVLNLPLVTGLLFVVGLVALYIEFSAPGISVGGLTAILCFALFFWSRFMGGTADWLEVVLFVVGLIFLGLEMFVIPGFGVAGLSGLLLVGASLVLASQDFIVPHTSGQLSMLARSLLLVVGSMLAFIILAALLATYLGRVPILNRLALEPPPAEPARGSLASTASANADLPVQVGDVGRADSPLRPSGKARFGDHWVDVATEGAFVEPGRPIKVVRIAGRKVIVREVDEQGAFV